MPENNRDEFIEQDEFIENNSPAENEEEPKKKKRGWVWVILAIIIIILLLLCHSCASSEKELESTGGLQMGIIDMDSLTNQVDRETLQKTLDQQVEAGMVSLFMNTDIKVDNNQKANWLIQNIDKNGFDMQVNVADEETNEVIYVSPKIKPGYKVEEDLVLTNLPAGKHPCLATFALYDTETGDLVNYVGLKVSVTFP